MTNGKQTLESMSQAVWYNEWTLQKFLPHLKGDILEIGCGIGNFTNSLTKYGNVWAVDIEKEYIEKTKKNTKGKVKVGFGDIEKGEYFFDKKFDVVICINVLEHIKDDKRALKNLYNLLKKEGKLILLVPAHDFLYGGIDKAIGHYRRYQKDRLSLMMVNLGFKIISARALNFLGALGWWFSSKLLGKSIVEEGKVKVFNVIAPIILPLENIVEPPFGTSVLIIAQK